LESIVNESYKNIDKTLEARAKTTLKYLAPGVYQGLILLEFLYKRRGVIMKTIDTVAGIWSDDSTPVSDKVLSTAGEVVKVGAEIVKDEFKEKGVSYIAGAFADQATEAIDQTGAIDTVSNAVGLSDHKDRFKDLLEDTIEKQTELVLKKAMGDKK